MDRDTFSLDALLPQSSIPQANFSTLNQRFPSNSVQAIDL